MENTRSFLTGLIAMILIIVTFWIPYHNHEVAYNLTMFGRIIGINAGILLLLAGIWNSKGLAGAGFGTGMTGWGLMVVTTIYGIIWNSSEFLPAIFWETFWAMLTALLMGNPLYFLIFFEFPTEYLLGYIGSITILCMSAAALTLGSISFGLVRKQGK